MITVSEAENLIKKNLPAPVAMTLPIENSLGYYLASDIKAERDYPPFDRITHDGIAVKFASLHLKKFRIESYSAAGSTQARLIDSANCIEVATGAPLPLGTDTVIPYEEVEIADGFATVKDDDFRIGSCLHLKGSDAKAGEILLLAGSKIGIAEITILAANGVANVPVYKKPKVGILSTGDELVGVADKALPHQIRRSNDIMLQSALALNGFAEVEIHWLPDDAREIEAHIEKWLVNIDVIITIGGVSKGSFDHLPDVFKSLAITKIFHHVCQRPGKPLWFGKHGKTLVFGLPGNPASSLTCLTRYVIPALRVMSGCADNKPKQMSLTEIVSPHQSLVLLLPVSFKKGRLTPLKTKGSGDFTSLKNSSGFVEISPSYITGEKPVYYPWERK